MASEAKAIQAKGAQIILKNGKKEYLRYGFMELEALEDKFGSLGAVSEAVEQAFHDDGKLKGPAYGFIWKVTKIGLMELELSDKELNQLADPVRMSEYFTAFSVAFSQALAGGADPKGQAKKAKTKPSPGETSTTSPPLSLAEPMSSSG